MQNKANNERKRDGGRADYKEITVGKRKKETKSELHEDLKVITNKRPKHENENPE